MMGQSPEYICSFLAHEGGTTSASFSPDGQTLATGGYDCNARLWDVGTWRQVRALPGHRRGHVAFSPDGAILISGGLHRNAIIYDTATWQPNRTLYRTNGIWDLAFAPEGSRITITQPYDDEDDDARPIEVKNTVTWHTVRTVGVGASIVYAVAFSPNGEHIAVAVGRGLVGIWSACFALKLAEFTSYDIATWGVAFSADGSTVATGGAETSAPPLVEGRHGNGRQTKFKGAALAPFLIWV